MGAEGADFRKPNLGECLTKETMKTKVALPTVSRNSFVSVASFARHHSETPISEICALCAHLRLNSVLEAPHYASIRRSAG